MPEEGLEYYLKVLNSIPTGKSIWLKYRTERSTTFLRVDRKEKEKFKLHGENSRSYSGSAEKIARVIAKSPYLSKAVPVEIDDMPQDKESAWKP